MTMQADNSAPAAEQTSAATPEPAAPVTETQTPSEPEAPLTPGEAAKQARLNAEASARLARAKKVSDKLYREKQEFEAAKRARDEEMTAKEKKYADQIASLTKRVEELSTGNPLLRKDLTHEQRTAYLRELVDEGTPEAKVAQFERLLAKQQEEFNAKLEAISAATKAREEEEQRRIAAARQGEEESKIRQFALWATGPGKEFCKYLNAEHTQTEILHQTAAIVDFAIKNKKVYSAQEIAEYLEDRAKKRHDSLAQARGTLGSPPPAPPVVASPVPKVAPPVSGKKPPVQVRQRTKEEEEEADKAALRRAFAADAAQAGKKK